MKTHNLNICFVIMPFNNIFDGYYNQIYKKAIKKAGLNPIRVDELKNAGKIVEDIWNLTASAEIILADLTSSNPNVFYELGLAHAMGKPVVILTQEIDKLPFDLRDRRAICYNTQIAGWEKKLQKSIEESLLETLSNPQTTFSHDHQMKEIKDELAELNTRFELYRISEGGKKFGIGNLLGMYDEKMKEHKSNCD